MLKILIVVHEDVILSSLIAPLDMFERCNQMLAIAGQEPAFHVTLVSHDKSVIALAHGGQFKCARIAEINLPGTSDCLVVVPAFVGEWDAVVERNRALIAWLRGCREVGAEVASLCVGAFFLAEAGLLDGRACTSHWRVLPDLQQRYPQVRAVPDAVITDEEGIYTGGGAFSSLNLVLYLVEKFCGRAFAVEVSKNFSIHMDHCSQSQFSVFQGQRQHQDPVVLKCQDLIEREYQNELSVEQLAQAAHMSKRNFVRRFKQATHNTPLEYLQRVKIEVAKKFFEQGQKNILLVMGEVGYSDVKTFRQIFKRYTGLTPQSYRAKYSRSAP